MHLRKTCSDIPHVFQVSGCFKWSVPVSLLSPPRSPDSVVVVVGGDEGSALQCWSQWGTVSQPSRQLDWMKDRREEKSSGRPGRRWEPVARQTDGQINRRAGGRPDGRVETLRWSQPVPPNDRVSQTENKEGEEKEKHCCSRPLSLAPPHFLLASVSVTLSFTFSQLFSSLPPSSGESSLVWLYSRLLPPPYCCDLLRPLTTLTFTWSSHSYSLSFFLLFLSLSFPSHLSGLAARQTEAAS